MRWADIDGEWWNLPSEFSKLGRPMRIRISPQARNVLDEIEPLSEGSEWVFPRSREPNQPRWPFRNAMRQTRQASQVDFRQHDLWLTAAIGMRGASEPREAVLRWGKSLEEVVTGI